MVLLDMASHLSELAPSAIVMDCPGCGTRIKVKPELAGKKCKCPRCGHVLVAPVDAAVAPPTALWQVVLPPLLLALVLWSTFMLKLYNLDHTALTRWDEVFHAIVARNVLKHPLRPTLVDEPYMPYDHKKWNENHVWLHKPIVPFWQIALSFALFGVNTFALRLPAAILSTGAAWLAYLIGKELFDRGTGLIAATLLALNPFLFTLVHGYQFADNIDVALLFWVEVAIYFLVRAVKTGAWRYVILAGVAQGLAYLCKSHLAAIIFGLALAVWLLPICRLVRREDVRLTFTQLLTLFTTTLATVAPWTIYSMLWYPDEFWHENAMILNHLSTNVENWAAPWDRVLFDYMIAISGRFYSSALVAAIVLLPRMLMRRHLGLWLTLLWSLGVLVPHVCAVTKTPSATLLALPALTLLLSYFIFEALRGDRWLLAAIVGVAIMNLIWVAEIRPPGWSFPTSRAFGAIMRQSMWVAYHVAGSVAVLGLFGVLWLIWSLAVPEGTARRIAGRCVHASAAMFCLGVLGWLSIQSLNASWRVVNRNELDPVSVEIGAFVQTNLPENAVLFCEERKGYEHLTIMFYADRTCYPLPWTGADRQAHAVREAGGVPYLVVRRNLPLEAVHVSRGNVPTIYLWRPLEPRDNIR